MEGKKGKENSFKEVEEAKKSDSAAENEKLKLLGSDLLTLRRQFQDVYLAHVGVFWKGTRMLLTLIFSLFSLQSGLLLLFLTIGSDYIIVLIIIPISICILCYVGIQNANRDGRNVLEDIACLAKIEEKIDFSRVQNRRFFVHDESILSDRWINARETYETTKDFVKAKVKIGSGTMFGVIKTVYIILFIIALLIAIIIGFIQSCYPILT